MDLKICDEMENCLDDILVIVLKDATHVIIEVEVSVMALMEEIWKESATRK